MRMKIIAAAAAMMGILVLLVAILFAVDGAGSDKAPAEPTERAVALLSMRTIPNFLVPQPEKTKSFLVGGIIEYGPLTATDPTVLLSEFGVPIMRGTQPRNPIEWRLTVDQPERLVYYAVFKCGLLTIDAGVYWEHPASREQVPFQLKAIKDELDSRCVEFVGAG